MNKNTAISRAKTYAKKFSQNMFIFTYKDFDLWLYDYCTEDEYYYGSCHWVPQDWVICYIGSDGQVLEWY